MGRRLMPLGAIRIGVVAEWTSALWVGVFTGGCGVWLRRRRAGGTHRQRAGSGICRFRRLKFTGDGRKAKILNNARQISGPFPRTAGPGETLVRRNPDTGAPTHCQTYDRDGLPVKRADLTGRPHGIVPTPHVVEFERHVSPDTGEVFVKAQRIVRPAKPEEIP